mgnify:CR=1 FL=1
MISFIDTNTKKVKHQFKYARDLSLETPPFRQEVLKEIK